MIRTLNYIEPPDSAHSDHLTGYECVIHLKIPFARLQSIYTRSFGKRPWKNICQAFRPRSQWTASGCSFTTSTIVMKSLFTASILERYLASPYVITLAVLMTIPFGNSQHGATRMGLIEMIRIGSVS